MLRVNDIEDRLVELRSGHSSVAEFDRWLMSVAWNLHQKVPVESRVYELVREIEGLISEYEQGEFNESELQRELFLAAELEEQGFAFSAILSERPAALPIETRQDVALPMSWFEGRPVQFQGT